MTIEARQPEHVAPLASPLRPTRGPIRLGLLVTGSRNWRRPQVVNQAINWPGGPVTAYLRSRQSGTVGRSSMLRKDTTPTRVMPTAASSSTIAAPW